MSTSKRKVTAIRHSSRDLFLFLPRSLAPFLEKENLGKLHVPTRDSHWARIANRAAPLNGTLLNEAIRQAESWPDSFWTFAKILTRQKFRLAVPRRLLERDNRPATFRLLDLIIEQLRGCINYHRVTESQSTRITTLGPRRGLRLDFDCLRPLSSAASAARLLLV